MVKFLSQRSCCWRPPAPARIWLCFFLVLMLAAVRGSAAPKFETSLNQNSISLGESVTLSFVFTDCSPNGQLNLPALPDIQIGARGSVHNRMAGNQVSTSLTYTFDLHPTREGDFIIPAMRVQVDNGQQMTSKPLKFKVTKAMAPQTDGAPEVAFMRIGVPDRPIYIGETVPLEIHCYYQAAQSDQIPQIPLEGFTLGNMSGQQASRVAIKNVVYNHAIFRAPLTTTKAGKIKLGPATWAATLLSRPNVWGQYTEARNAVLTSDTPEMNVQPLPPGAPADFSGAIGTFSLDLFEAGPTNVAVGDPITIKARIAGTGALDLLTLPQTQPEWREFKMYPPISKTESTDPLQLDGAKYFEQVVAPQNAGIKELPAFSFSFFDPQQQSYQTLRHPAIPLIVRPTAATPQPTVLAKETNISDTPAPSQEIVHIKSELGRIQSTDRPLIQSPGFLALQFITPMAWLGAILWRRQREKLTNNPRLRRQREVARLVKEGLKGLPSLAQANKTEEFYAAVFQLLQEQLGERLDLPASAITEAVLDDLQPDQISAETRTALRELFHICNQFRYAPEYAKQELASLIPKVEQALKDLQGVSPSTKRVGIVKAAVIACLTLASASMQAEGVVAAGSTNNLNTLESSKANASSAFHRANGFYEQGKFSEAADAYQTMVESGLVSVPLYFNLGNACFKSGQAGRAILAYRNAEKLAPRDPDIRANLQFARNQIGTGNSALFGSRWTRFLNRLTVNEWTLLTSVALAAFFLVLTVKQLVHTAKKALGGTTLGLGMACALLIACLGLSVNDQLYTQSAVVIVPEAVIRRGPFNESQSVISARDGSELLVLKTKDEWLEVLDSTKHTGWLLKKDVALVR